MAETPSINPYEPPKHDQLAADQYRPLGWKTTASSVGIVLSVVFALALGVGGMATTAEGPAQPAQPTATALVVAFIALVSLVVNVFTWVVFLMWTHQAAKNVRAFGRHTLAHSPAWAVGSWFVPMLSLVVPYQALTEIWRASDPDRLGASDISWRDGHVPALFPVWWGTYLVHGLVGTFTTLLPLLSGKRAEGGGGGGVVGLGACFFLAIAAVAIVSLMKQLDQRQALSASKLSLR